MRTLFLSNCCFVVRQRNACVPAFGSCVLRSLALRGAGEFDQIISMKLQIVKTSEAVKVTKDEIYGQSYIPFCFHSTAEYENV